MFKYETGDIVTPKSAWYNLTPGKGYAVVDTWNYSATDQTLHPVIVGDDGRKQFRHSIEVQLVGRAELASKFKVGDVVRRNDFWPDKHRSTSFVEGAAYVVTAVDGVWVRLDGGGTGGWHENMFYLANLKRKGERFSSHLTSDLPDRRVGDLLFDETTTVVEGEGGARKGQKIARFDLIPAEALSELAIAYGKGAEKYGDSNWLKGGYKYSLAIGALLRHLYRWIRREDFDPETGVHHLALVAWHCFALMTFQTRGLGEDDRSASS